MYVPAFSAIDEHEARAIVADVASGWLVTSSDAGPPVATLMPILWEGTRIVAHMARANPHWRDISDGRPGLLIVGGPEAYVSPTWYAAKAEHGKVVPTWNYVAVHLSGTVTIHHDPRWLLSAVSDLTREHEAHRANPWNVSDAPDDYVAGQLRAIVGIEMTVTHVEGKAKLGQNRSEPDVRGVIEGLRRDPDPRSGTAVAAAMSARLRRPAD